MNLLSAAIAIRKYWWLVVASGLAALAAGAFVTMNAQPEYQTTVRFYANTPSDGVLAAVQGDQFGRSRVDSYVELFGTEKLARLVITDSGLTLTPAQVISKIRASADVNTVLINITVTDTSQDEANRIGASLATQFPVLVKGIETPKGALTAPVQVEVVSGPTPGARAVSPVPARNLGIGLLAGLVLGLGLALAKEGLDTTVRSTATVRSLTGGPVLGLVPIDTDVDDNPVILDGFSRSLRAEAYRQVRTNIKFVEVDVSVKVIAVTSAVSGEGKTATTVNLALSFVNAGRRVLLIEADLRKPMISHYLGLGTSVGLTDVLVGDVALPEAMQRWGDSDLTVLVAGSTAPNPSELLESRTMVGLIERCRQQFDVVLIDAAPLLPVTDGAVVARDADGVILVVRHGSTTRNQIVNAIGAMDTVEARLLGTVMNMVPTRGADSVRRDHGVGHGNRAYFDDPRHAARVADPSADPLVARASASARADRAAAADDAGRDLPDRPPPD
ncbi:capsular exopolysaccharide synthesis family protein [Nakamurella sp. UYEF19]|uniref:polysaccharide biosynthesis tyrosine autokinase n=1 Tax=Nakamurella sp. UYEF19 TaxID=1756392 RepID=UPI0033930854